MNWKQGEDVIIAGSVSDDDAKLFPAGWKAPSLPAHRAATALKGGRRMIFEQVATGGCQSYLVGCAGPVPRH